MRHSNVLSSASEPRGAAVVTTAFAALVIGVGTIIVTSASAASADTPTDRPAPAIEQPAVAVQPTVNATDTPPPAIEPDAPTPSDPTVPADAAPITNVEPANSVELPAPEPTDADPANTAAADGDTTEAAVVEALRIEADPRPAAPIDVLSGLGEPPTGCAAGCITDVTVEQLVAGSTDMVLTAHTDTPADMIVAMMALDQGDEPVGGDPYGASHGLVTEWTIELVDLLPATTYEYAVIAIDGQGGTDTYGGTFTTGLQLTGDITAVVPVEVSPDRLTPGVFSQLSGRSE